MDSMSNHPMRHMIEFERQAMERDRGQSEDVFIEDEMATTPLVEYRKAHPENIVWSPEKGWHDN